LPGRFDSVFAVHTTGVAPRFIVHRGGEHFDLRFIDGEPILRPMERPPLDEMLVASGVRGLTLYKRDGEDGTTLHLLRDGEPERSAMAFNQHLRAVVTPPARELHLELNGRRLTGVLRLPPGRRQTDRHPVVIRAYPGSLPAVGDRSHRVNSAASTYEPFQYLLARGFAVFIVPFPVELAPHPAGPLQMSVDAVLPWLEILDRQPEILAGEYAYWGHSNGGYVGLALATRATPFKAIAVSSTFPDLHWTLDAGLEFTPLDSAGEIMQVRRFVYEYDAQPYSLGAPPWRAQERWIRNSPVFNLDQAATPMLLIVGEFDFATPRPLERVYSTLRARGVPVEMAQYWGEAHVITSPENLFDSWTRAERFFKRYLRME
jgi:dipeptidyl aminopeptidase/acylaminoacyl peptidase